MAFSSRGDGSSNPWRDRTLQNPDNKTKRKITDSSNNSQVVNFIKNEGKSYNSGTPFNAANMKNLENRIAAGFSAINDLVSPTVILDRFYPVGVIYTSFDSTNPANILGGGTWVPISGGLLMCGDGMPDRMISGNNVNYQMTPDYNNQVLSPQCHIDIPNRETTKNLADLPSHSHIVTGDLSPKYSIKSERTDNSEWGWEVHPTKTTNLVSTGDSGRKKTTQAGNSAGHSHSITIDAANVYLNLIPVNIEKPAVTVYCWVRTA